MRYLFDTCIISDLLKSHPPAPVVAWAAAHDLSECALSTMTLGEVRRGIALLPAGAKRDRLSMWLEHHVPEQFERRILPVNAEVAQTWGVFSARARTERRTLPRVDGILLATAAVNRLAVVTRNVRDFSGYDVQVINPWEPQS